MALSPAALHQFNRVYKDTRLLARSRGVIFPPYPVVLKRVEKRAEQLNRLAAAGTALDSLPLHFWSDIFGKTPVRHDPDQSLLRGVQKTMEEHGAVPDRCEACGRVGLVLIDTRADGSARGWLCERCHGAAAACSDATTLRKLAAYCG